MSKRCISNECLETTGFSYTLSLINGKYKMTILYTLMEFGVVRFNEDRKSVVQGKSVVDGVDLGGRRIIKKKKKIKTPNKKKKK